MQAIFKPRRISFSLKFVFGIIGIAAVYVARPSIIVTTSKSELENPIAGERPVSFEAP